MKKCLIIYHSYHRGNTEKIAKTMAEACGAELCKAGDAAGKILNDYEIIGLGAGIAVGKHYAPMREAAAKLDLKGRAVFVFSTSGQGGTKSHKAFVDQLKNAGAAVKGEFGCKGFSDLGPFKLFGGMSKGHPNAEDIEAAKQFALKMTK